MTERQRFRHIWYTFTVPAYIPEWMYAAWDIDPVEAFKDAKL